MSSYSNADWYIAFNPDKTPLKDVPSDIRGIDRIQYTSFDEYETKLAALITQRFPQRREGLDAYLDDLGVRTKDLLRRVPGQKIAEIANVLGITVKVAQLVISNISDDVRTTGDRKGTRYYLK